jgi:hypothetical protein
MTTMFRPDGDSDCVTYRLLLILVNRLCMSDDWRGTLQDRRCGFAFILH